MPRGSGQKAIKNISDIKNLADEIDKILNNIDASKLSDDMAAIKDLSEGIADTWKNTNEYFEYSTDLAEEELKAAKLAAKYAGSRNIFSKTYYGLQLKNIDSSSELVNSMKENVELMEWQSVKAKELDVAFEGMGETIRGFLTSPLTAIVAIMGTIGQSIKTMTDQFGAMPSGEFRDDMMGAQKEAILLGKTLEDSQKTMVGLNKQFGIGFQKSKELSDSTLQLALVTATTDDNAVKLMGTLTELAGLSEEQAFDLARQTEELARQNDVAPGQVLDDIAENMELFAKYSDGSADNLLRAAIQARKLGIELKDVETIATGLLDFQSSLTAELEASVMIGRQLNLNRARELALAGDLENLQTEILNQVGSQAEFEAMNVLQRQKLASAIGISVDKLANMVSKEKEAVTLMGELAKQDITKMVPEETIHSVAQLISQLKVLGIQLVEKIGPPILQMVKGFVWLANAMEKVVGSTTGLLAIMGVMLAKTMLTTYATIVQTVATLALMTSKMGAATFGVGIGPGLLLTAKVMAGMTAGIAAVAGMAMMKEGGMVEGKPGVGVPVRAGEGGEPEIISPLSKLGTLVNVDNTAVASEVGSLRTASNETNKRLDTLIQNMEGYFGFGGGAAKRIGESAASGIMREAGGI